MPVRGGRIARLFQLIALLKGPSSWNGRRLAEHFRTTRRNIQRDVQVLRMAGVPVIRDEEFGEGGSYRIRSDFFLPKANLTDQECLDLSVMARIAETRSLPLLQQAAQVRDKILQVLPAQQQDIIRDASMLFEVMSLGMADHSRCAKVMTEIQKALLTSRQIEAVYASPRQKRSKKIQLQPRRVFLAGQSWYLAAYDNDQARTKLYRLPRFHSVKVLEKPIALQDDWSLKEELGHAWTVFRGERDYHIEIDFNPDAAELVREVKWHPTQELFELPDGWVRFRATVSGLDEIKYWLLSWGPRAVVRKPVELIDEIRQLAEDIAQLYPNRTNQRGKNHE
jgi:predicted DNA-binding transcriptional regulator YafY